MIKKRAMKRDMELVRKLLLSIESDRDWGECVGPQSLETVLGHLEIMMDAKLLIGRLYKDENGDLKAVDVYRLTWAGHEFLDNARNDTVWKNVMTRVKSVGATASFEVLVELLKSAVKSCMGMPE